jgi:hypothetical protein
VSAPKASAKQAEQPRMPRVTYFDARTYLDERWSLKWIWEKEWSEDDSGYKLVARKDGANAAALSALHYLARNAMFDKCSDESYGDVTFEKCGTESIQLGTGLGHSTVSTALRTLEQVTKSITREQGGRRAHKPDRISVRPLLDEVLEHAKVAELRAKMRETSVPDVDLVLRQGMVYNVNGSFYQLGRLTVDAMPGMDIRHWDVWSREHEAGWHPGTTQSRRGQWWHHQDESSILREAWQWFTSAAY